jgi:RNA polymerase sigma-70 factor (ECF subfamily)
MKDKKAYFEKVYDTYTKQIFRFIYLRTNNTQITEDINSETFLRFWKSIEQEIVINNERALLYTIARRIIIDYYRSKKNKDEVQLDESLEDKHYNYNEMIEKLYLDQRIAKVYEKLKKIKKEYQEIIILRFVEDLEYEEIAVILGRKENNIRVLVHRAIDNLKKIL